jgi:hypothetical protein
MPIDCDPAVRIFLLEYDTETEFHKYRPTAMVLPSEIRPSLEVPRFDKYHQLIS